MKKTRLMLLAVITFASPALAVSPPPDGGYPNETTAEGEDALFSLTTGFWNTAVGFEALYSDTTGLSNVAVGHKALSSNTTGNVNTAVGVGALTVNTTGSLNTAVGGGALDANTTGSDNTAAGESALVSNTIGWDNTAVGAFALEFNPTGFGNTAVGQAALQSNTANSNTACGNRALSGNTTGSNNSAFGTSVLQGDSSADPNGSNNTAVGFASLELNKNGNNNTAVGYNALGNNTFGSSNIALGDSAGSVLTTGKNNIDIGNAGVAGESAKIRIGNKAHKNTYIAGISGVTVAGGVGVIIDTTGHLGTVTSSVRYKEAIQPMNASSEAILSLQPVKFRYKKDLDVRGIPQFGLVAEDVAKVDPDLVARDEEGKPYTVRYEAVNAMLLNEFLKEHRKGQQQDRKIEELETTVAQLQTALRAQAAQIQKVSDQLEAQASAPRVVANK